MLVIILLLLIYYTIIIILCTIFEVKFRYFIELFLNIVDFIDLFGGFFNISLVERR